MKFSIFIIESNYESLYKTVAYATIDKAKAYREFEHYVELIKKNSKKENYVTLLRVDNEHFPYEIAKYDTKEDSCNYDDLGQYLRLTNDEKPLNAMDILEECTYVSEELKKEKSWLENIDVFCDDRKVIRASYDDSHLDLYTHIL